MSAASAAENLKAAMRAFNEEFWHYPRSPVRTKPPHTAGQCCGDGTKEEKREHALWLVRNRNTGPAPYYHFDAYGKKNH